MFTLQEPITLRPVGPDDQAFLDHLYVTSRGDLQQLHAETPFIEQLMRMQQRTQMLGFQQNFPDAQHWIVLRHAKAIGRMIVDIARTDMRLVDVVVLPEAQGQGVGEALLRAMQHFAQEKNLTVSLAVNKTNRVAKNLYTKVGFVPLASDDLFDQMHWGAITPPLANEVRHAT